MLDLEELFNVSLVLEVFRFMKTCLRFFISAFAGVMALASVQSFAADKGGTAANFSGHMRTRFEMVDNQNAAKTKWGEQFLNRARVNMDLMPMDSLKVRITPQANWQWSDGSNLAATNNVASLYLYEGWMSWMPSDSVALWVGRQEVVYGKKRIFTAQDWSQRGVTHDAARVRFSFDMGTTDLFWVKGVESHFDATGSLATRSPDTDVFALYNSFNLSEQTGFLNTADLYATLEMDQSKASKTGYFMVGTLLDGGVNDFDFNVELAGQMGKYRGAKSQKGLMGALEAGYTFMEKHRVGMEAVYTNSEWKDLVGTDHAHLGKSDLVTFNSNLMALAAKAKFQLSNEFDAGIDGWYFMKAKKAGNNPATFAERTAGKKGVGFEVDLALGYNAEDNLRFDVGYNLFVPNGSTKLSGTSATNSDMHIQGTLKF